MKKVGVITNINKDPRLKETMNIIKALASGGCRVYAPGISEEGEGIHCISESKLYETVDYIIVLGGDGTILQVAKKAALNDVPLLGVNFGTLGYLADVDKKDTMEAVERVLSGKYTIEERMMLQARLVRSNGNEWYTALNEVCITNSEFSRIISLKININGAYINTVKADGIILATPTGSTAYNLSAGGPILNPDTRLITLTYICPHTLNSRPLVLSENDVITINAESRYNGIRLSCDGQKAVTFESGDVIEICRSPYVTKIIKTTDLNFYDILRRKMVDADYK